MRILFVLTSLGAGGTERSTALLLPELQRRGLDVEVAVLRRTDIGDEQRVRESGVPVHLCTGRTFIGRARAVRSLIRSRRPDIVHTAIFDADIAGRLGAWRSGSRVVSSLVNTPYDAARLADANVPTWKLRATQLADALTARMLTDRLHAVSEGVATANAAALHIDRSRISVVERGRSIDPPGPGPDKRSASDRRTAIRRTLGIDDSTVVLLAVGRQEYQKGHVHLVDALSALRDGAGPDGTPDIVALIAGREGNATAALTERLEVAGLGERIRLLGHRDDVADLLLAADLFVLPSLYEGTAGAAIEAMAAGTPIISSDLAGLVGVLEAGRNAWLVPPGDSDALAAQIAVSALDRSAGKRLAVAARDDFDRTFTLGRSADRMVDFYAAVERGDEALPSRWPDFIVIGAMKSSTTSLFRWLDEHPGTALPPEKEPAYFVADRDPRERRTYRRLLATPEGQLTGEASVAYTRWPDRGAAQRIAVDAPAARLVYVLRDPIERLISHHRHEVQRGRERRPLEDAVEQDPTYVETSRYGAILESWLDAVPARQVLVVDFEKLTGESHDEWHRVLDFLGLDRIDRPPAAHNLSVEKAPFTRLGGRLYGGHLMRRAGRLPRPIRTTLRRLAIRPAGTPSVVGTGADDILRSRLDALLSDDRELLRRIAPGTYDGSAFAPSWMAT